MSAKYVMKTMVDWVVDGYQRDGVVPFLLQFH